MCAQFIGYPSFFYAFDQGERVVVRGEVKGFSELYSWGEDNVRTKELDSDDSQFSGEEMIQLDDGVIVVGENLTPRKPPITGAH